jgi:putative transposase
MNTDRKKWLVQELLFTLVKRYGLSLYAWVILGNHYHILVKINDGVILPRFIQKFHSDIALLLNGIDRMKGRKIFYQYWDTCICSEKGFWTRFNYTHHNPVKHGLEKKMEDYQFSSYQYYLKKYGQQWIDSCFWLYPIVDFTEANDAKLSLR